MIHTAHAGEKLLSPAYPYSRMPLCPDGLTQEKLLACQEFLENVLDDEQKKEMQVAHICDFHYHMIDSCTIILSNFVNYM